MYALNQPACEKSHAVVEMVENRVTGPPPYSAIETVPDEYDPEPPGGDILTTIASFEPKPPKLLVNKRDEESVLLHGISMLSVIVKPGHATWPKGCPPPPPAGTEIWMDGAATEPLAVIP